MGTTLKRRRWVTLGSISLALVLSACFAAVGSPGKESGSASSNESARDDHAVSAVPLPEQGTPERFIHTWVGELNRVESEGEVAGYLLMSKDCAVCMEFALKVRKYYESGGRIETDGWRVLEVRALEDEDNSYLLRVQVSASTYIAGPGVEDETYEESVMDLQVDLVRDGPRWRVEDFDLYDEDQTDE